MVLKNKQPVILPVKWIYLGIAGIAIQDKHATAKTIGTSNKLRRGTLFYEGKRGLWGGHFAWKTIGGKRSVQGGDRFLLGELLGKVGHLPSSCWSCKTVWTCNVRMSTPIEVWNWHSFPVGVRTWRRALVPEGSPFWPPDSFLHEVSLFLIFPVASCADNRHVDS